MGSVASSAASARSYAARTAHGIRDTAPGGTRLRCRRRAGSASGCGEAGSPPAPRLSALDARREQVSRGIVVNDRLTVGQYLAEWLAAKTDIRPSTHRAYGLHISKYLAPGLGHLRMTDLRVAHVAECLADVTSSAANRQRVRATLRAALPDAVRQGLISVNPAALVKLRSGKRPKALVWTAERVQRREAAAEKLALAKADGSVRERLETAAQPPSPAMVWTPAQLGASSTPPSKTSCIPCFT
jgi:Phage integrase, N-terminal SAM-like domain